MLLHKQPLNIAIFTAGEALAHITAGYLTAREITVFHFQAQVSVGVAVVSKKLFLICLAGP